MDAVLREIKKGQHPLMLDYVEFSFDECIVNGKWIREESISPAYFSPLKVKCDETGTKTFSGIYLTQGFYEYKTWNDFMNHYMRMVRCGKQDYLHYSALTRDLTTTLETMERYCDSCENIFNGDAFGCYTKRCTQNGEICLSCYETNQNCQICAQPLTPI